MHLAGLIDTIGIHGHSHLKTKITLCAAPNYSVKSIPKIIYNNSKGKKKKKKEEKRIRFLDIKSSNTLQFLFRYKTYDI